MNNLYLNKGMFPAEYLRPTVDFILETQTEDGSIPWFTGGHLDPWDHTEGAMGLSVGGEYEAAERAYLWLKNEQLDDGSWWESYFNGVADKKERRETNFVAYVATGLWHHYLISENKDFLRQMWPVVTKAVGFVLAQQSEFGEINWAIEGDGRPKEDALITGCSSIYKSLECACNIAVTLGEDASDWAAARAALGDALRNKPERFDRTWDSKARYSMDWFYPILAGLYTPDEAKARLMKRWDEFVEHGQGVRCVSDEPWVTVAESCELTMALLAAGDRQRAMNMFSWLHQWRHESGAFWTGFQKELKILWPEEMPAWTAGAIMLAADALTEHTPAWNLFLSVNLLDPTEDCQRIHEA